METNEIIITQACIGEGSCVLATNKQEGLAGIVESGLNFISKGKLSTKEMALYLEKSKLPKSSNLFSKVDVSSLSDSATMTVFRLPVFACSGACEVDSGDSVVLVYPPMCLEDFNRCCLEPNYVVAIKYDEGFSSAKACEIFLSQSSYPYTKEDSKGCIKSFEDVPWEKLLEEDQAYTKLIEVVSVEIA